MHLKCTLKFRGNRFIYIKARAQNGQQKDKLNPNYWMLKFFATDHQEYEFFPSIKNRRILIKKRLLNAIVIGENLGSQFYEFQIDNIKELKNFGLVVRLDFYC